MLQLSTAAVATALLMFAGGCGAPSGKVADRAAAPKAEQTRTEKSVTSAAPINQRFANLEAYLLWLRQSEAPIGGSWYEEVRPGVYELKTGNLRVLGPSGDETPKPKTFTREELEKQFGFR